MEKYKVKAEERKRQANMARLLNMAKRKDAGVVVNVTRKQAGDAELCKPVIALENSNDDLAIMLDFFMKQAEILLAKTLYDQTMPQLQKIIAEVQSMTNQMLEYYLANDYCKQGESFRDTAVIVEYGKRNVMGKLKGKFSGHADNVHIRNRRFTFIKAINVFMSNCLSMDTPYTYDSIKHAVDDSIAMVRGNLGEYLDKEMVDKLMAQYAVVARLNMIARPYRERVEKDSVKANTEMASDLELLDEFISALLDFTAITGCKEYNAIMPMCIEYFDTVVDKYQDIVSYKISNISGRTYAMRMIDKYVSAYRHIDVAEVGDADKSIVANEKRGSIHFLSAEEKRTFNYVSSVIVVSDTFKKEEKADAISVLAMLMQGYGLQAIASYLCLTKSRAQVLRDRLRLALATDDKYKAHIAVEKDSRRNNIAVYVSVAKEETPAKIAELTARDIDNLMQYDAVYTRPQHSEIGNKNRTRAQRVYANDDLAQWLDLA